VDIEKRQRATLSFYFVQFVTGLASACSLFLVASGLSIIFGVTRVVNFAHGAFYMLGAYIGYTLTDRLGELFEKRAKDAGVSVEEIEKQSAAAVPIGRLSRPDEFAALVAFLCSERASSMTGTTIQIDGGLIKGLL